MTPDQLEALAGVMGWEKVPGFFRKCDCDYKWHSPKDNQWHYCIHEWQPHENLRLLCQKCHCKYHPRGKKTIAIETIALPKKV